MRLLRDQTGATAVEYGLLTMLIAVGVFELMHTTGQGEAQNFCAISATLSPLPDEPGQPVGPNPGALAPGQLHPKRQIPTPVAPTGPVSTPTSPLPAMA